MWQQMKDTGQVMIHPTLGEMRVWMNDRYIVGVRLIVDPLEAPYTVNVCAHLNIASLDGKPRHDWRDFQRIKNDVCGEDTEGVELYPAESRLVDAANNYHLWVWSEKLPFGFNFRAVAEGAKGINGCHQSPFGADRPADCIDLSACKTLADVAALLPNILGTQKDAA